VVVGNIDFREIKIFKVSKEYLAKKLIQYKPDLFTYFF